MTEEEVVNVRGEEISESGNDHNKIKAEHCNGGAHTKENDKNCNVGGEADGEIVAVAESGASDPIVTADGNGAASEDRKVDGESRVMVTEGERECEVVDNNNKENDCADACAVSNGSAEETCKTTIADVVEPEGESGIVDGQNGTGSAVVSADEMNVIDSVAEDGDEFITVQNDASDKEQRECTVNNEIHDEVTVTNSSVKEGVTVHDRELESVEVGASDVQNGVAAENEICGDVDVNKDVAAADVDKSDRELEGAAVENGAVDRNKEIEVPVVVEGVTATTDVADSIDSDVQGRSEAVTDKDHENVESENVVVADVSHMGTNGTNDVELESVGGAEVSECGEKNEIPVAVNGVCDSTDVKECAGEDAVEEVHVECLADKNIQNGLTEVEVSECSEENKVDVDGESGAELERSGEESGREVVSEGENLSALKSADMVGDVAVVSEGAPSVVDICSAVENEAEPSNDVKDEGEPSVDVSEVKNDAVGSKAVPSNNAVEPEAEPSDNAVERGSKSENGEGEPSVDVPDLKTDAVETEAEYAVGSEAEPSDSAVQGEADSSVDVPDLKTDAVEGEVEYAVGREAEPSNHAVEREAEPSDSAVQGEADSSVDVPDLKTDAVETEAEYAVGSEAEPSDSAVQGEADSSVDVPDLKTDAVEGEVEYAVGREAEPSNNAVEREAEPSVSAVQGEADSSVDVPDLKTDAVESEVEYAVVREAEPSNNAVESEAEPSDSAVQGEADSSVDVPDLKTNAVESEVEYAVVREAEPSNNAVESEAEPSDSAVQVEADSSVDVPDLKTDAVESESEPSVEAETSAEGEGSNQADDDSRPTPEGSAADALDGQSVSTEVVKRPFYYLIRVPRYDDDENIKEQIKNALHQVDEKTKIRDAIRAESQTKKSTCKEYGQAFRAAITEERAARDLLKAKRQEMDSVQSTMNRLNNVISVGDIDSKIRNMEHMIQHETLPLKEEKQLIRQIKQLKQNREELSTSMGKQDQSQSLDSIEEHSKQLQLLKKELEVLRNNVAKTETTTKAARKKYDEECNQLSEVLARFKAADDIRQEAYAKLHTLKKQLHEKSKYFWEYKNAATKGQDLAGQGKKEELQSFCIDQVERIMKLWNNNDEFRRNYVRCNTRSTLRRLQTLDGRSLGPDEEPPVIPNAFPERASKNDSLVSRSTLEQETKLTSTEPVNIKDEPVSKVVVQRTEGSQTTKAKKPAKPAPLEKSVVAVSRRWGDESDDDAKEEPVRTKEEEERILKAEKARKEEEAEKLKELRRLEEIEKAKEALQRKKRNAEKAQQRAAYKAQKEAEQKEKEREKRARKKEKRKAVSTDDSADSIEQDSVPSTEILTRATEECDQSEKPVEVTKRPQKPSQFTKQNKVKSLPMSIRNRGKRRIQSWMWVLIAVLVAVALFYMGNNSFLRSSLQSFGF